MNAIIPAGVTALVPTDMDQAIRLAQAMASAKLVPKHLQGDTGTCLMVVEQAMRWGMSPFAVAQSTSSIGGKLMYEGKLVAAAVESSGAIEGGFDYKFDGDGDARQVTVSARRRGETNPRQMTIYLRDVRTSNEWWKKQPDQMLVYSSTRNWARRWTPSVILGVYAPEEFDRTTGQIKDTFDGTTIEGSTEPSKSEPQPKSERDSFNAATPMDQPLKRETLREWMTRFEVETTAAQTPEEASRVLDPAMAMEEFLSSRPAARAQYDAIRQACIARVWAEPPEDDDEDAPEIRGEANVMAGD